MNKPYKLAVKAVILDEVNRSLLLRRSNACRHFAGQWEWPGGKLDEGEDFATALAREVREETALAIEITGLAGATQFEMLAFHLILLCMEARIVGGAIQLSDEHDDFAWLTLAELHKRELTDQTRAFMLDYAARKGTRRSREKAERSGVRSRA